MPARLSESDDTSADDEVKSVNDIQIPKGGLFAQMYRLQTQSIHGTQIKESNPDAIVVKKEVMDSEELSEMLKQASKTYGEIKAIVHELVKASQDSAV